jgi:hypothetical protein
MILYSTGIRPINYSYRGIYRGRFTYPLLLLHLFTPQQLYSSNILGAYSNFLSNPPLQLITPFGPISKHQSSSMQTFGSQASSCRRSPNQMKTPESTPFCPLFRRASSSRTFDSNWSLRSVCGAAREFGPSLFPWTLRRDPKVAPPNSSPSRVRAFLGSPEAWTILSRAAQPEVPPLGLPTQGGEIRWVSTTIMKIIDKKW